MLDIVKRIKNVVEHRELLLRLTFKDLKLRYKNLFLGFLWALLIPLCMIVIFKIVFSVIIKVDIKNYPFFIFLMTAMFPWSYFQQSISAATTSIVDSGNLIKKVYFPREIIPISIVTANLINFLFTLAVMLLILLFSGVRFTPLLLFLPAVLLIQTILTVGIALIVSGLQVRYRDVRYIVEVLLIAWFYLTPVFYPLTLVAGISKTFFRIYMFNPFVGLVTLYRMILLNGYIETLPPEINFFSIVGAPLISSVVVFFLGFHIFQRYERSFTDYI